MLAPWLGQDFFPSVDGGQFKLHLRARTGTRIEETARLCDRIDATVRQIIPPKELATIIDNIGVPVQRPEPLLQQLGADRARRTPTCSSR